MKHHWTWKANLKATTLWRKALCPWSSTYQPAVENKCIVVGTPLRFKCCISQNSLSLIIRFYAGEVKTIDISVEVHCSLPVPINLLLCKMQDFPVEDKIRIQRAGRNEKCHIGCIIMLLQPWMVPHTSVTGHQHCADWENLRRQLKPTASLQTSGNEMTLQ